MIYFCEIAAVETLSCKQVAWNFIKIWIHLQVFFQRFCQDTANTYFSKHFWICLKMLEKGLQLKTTILLVFFLWLMKSLKNL